LGLDEYRSVVFTAHRPEPLSEELPGNAATATATATQSFTTITATAA
jgi:hypothetical protein